METVNTSFNNVLDGVIQFIPTFLWALVIFIAGWIVAVILEKVVEQVAKAIKLDTLLENAGIGKFVKRAGYKLNIGVFLGEIVKWFVIVVALVSAFDVLGLDQVNDFLNNVVNYIPQLFAAVLILVVAVIVGDFMGKFVTSSAKAADVASASFLGSVTRWAIWVSAILAALLQLGVGVVFIGSLVDGVIIALALAFGLSYGLGGQDAAKASIDKFKKNVLDH